MNRILYRKNDKMLLATFLSTVFYSTAYPTIHKEIVIHISDFMIASEQIISCLGIVLASVLWNKYSDILFQKFQLFCVLETVAGITTTTYAIMSDNIMVYYILDTFVFALITRNIICGGNRLRSERYRQELEREHFDNNNLSASAIATIIGSCIAMLLDLDFKIMLCIATFGNALDNILYIQVYREQQNK
ncbi:MAG: hypothetical protein K2J40_05790 [Ruminococcus sp.]|nr:hypothetical protein [Ruminococcus sp.]